VSHHVILGIPVQHESVVGMLAAGPKADGLGEVPDVGT
jgi:hypothetical protein